MKKLAIFISIFSLLACEHDIINLSPVSELVTTNFYESEVDFDNALIAAYDVLQEKNEIDFVMSEIKSDNGTEMKYQYEKDIDNFSVNPTNQLVSDFWKIAYKGIFRANIILDKIGNADFADEDKNRIIGQAKFIRAYIYFDLVRYFGDVPLATSVLRLSESIDHIRNPVDEVYQLIESDLMEASALLPSVYPNADDMGRVTKGAANAMLAKVYLTRKKYSDAKISLEAVINDSEAGYQLLPVFDDVFSLENQNSKEIVFAIQYSSGTGQEGNDFMNVFGPVNPLADVASGGGSEHNMPTADLIRAYEPGDTRKAATLSEYVAIASDTVNTPYNRKYLVDQNVNDSGLDWPVIRYSDVILMYAEVLNELDDLSGAIVQINKIRERAFGDQIHNFDAGSIPNKDVFRTRVLNERRVELAFENHRWFDLVRTEKALEFLQVENRLADWRTGAILISLDLNMQAYQILYPIPLDEIEVSEGNLTQNPGY
ncbi:RagB/SusD family nutrient uptake outer membrane protein [Bacteroidota bacterium]